MLYHFGLFPTVKLLLFMERGEPKIAKSGVSGLNVGVSINQPFYGVHRMAQVQLNHDTALNLAKGAIATLDQNPLRPYIDAMMTEGYKDALAFSAISGDKPDSFKLFMAMCEDKGALSVSETQDLCLHLVRKTRTQTA